MITTMELEELKEWNKLDGFTQAFTKCPICHVFHSDTYHGHYLSLMLYYKNQYNKLLNSTQLQRSEEKEVQS